MGTLFKEYWIPRGSTFRTIKPEEKDLPGFLHVVPASRYNKLDFKAQKMAEAIEDFLAGAGSWNLQEAYKEYKTKDS